MSRKDKKNRERGKLSADNSSAVESRPLVSRRGLKLIGVGLGLVVLGFIALSFADPRGENFASQISPFLILGGYAVIGFGIVTKDPSVQPS